MKKPQLFHPGQEVVCIDDAWEVEGDFTPNGAPKLHIIYTVERYSGTYSLRGEPYLYLKEFPGGDIYEQCAFAPLISDEDLAAELAKVEHHELPTIL
jgi:hypothetical protein